MMLLNPYRFGGGSIAPPYVAIVGPKAGALGAQNVAIPSGYEVGDLLLLIVQTSNESVSAPSGWTEVGTYTGHGTPGSGNSWSAGLQVFYKYAVGSEPAASLPDNVRHTLAVILVIRGMSASGAIGATASADSEVNPVAFPGITTSADNSLVLMIGTDAYNSASDAHWNSWACAGLSSVSEIVDYGYSGAVGNFGGIGVAVGSKYTAGATGSGAASMPYARANISRMLEIKL